MPALNNVTPEAQRKILTQALVVAEECVYHACLMAAVDPITIGDSYPVTEESSPIDRQLSKELERLQFIKNKIAQL